MDKYYADSLNSHNFAFTRYKQMLDEKESKIIKKMEDEYIKKEDFLGENFNIHNKIENLERYCKGSNNTLNSAFRVENPQYLPGSPVRRPLGDAINFPTGMSSNNELDQKRRNSALELRTNIRNSIREQRLPTNFRIQRNDLRPTLPKSAWNIRGGKKTQHKRKRRFHSLKKR
jgi:hypothetical protein